MWTVALTLLKANWKPILIGVVILGGIVYHVGAVKLAERRGYNQATAEWEVKEQGWKKEVARWEAQVKQLNEEVEASKKAKKEVVQRNFDMFKESKKKNEVKKKEVTSAVKESIKPTDVVTVPLVFVELYNDAVAGTGSPDGSGREARPPADSTRAAGQIATFDAVAFTQVMLSNVLQYNELAVRCDALIDIVNELEDVENGIDSKGPI